jgi:hypothetical protein
MTVASKNSYQQVKIKHSNGLRDDATADDRQGQIRKDSFLSLPSQTAILDSHKGRFACTIGLGSN